MSADEMDDIVKDFLVESNENLELMDQHLLALERDPTQTDRIAGIFRGIHSIKGICGFLGFSRLEKVAHAGENLLSKLRDGKLTLNSDLGTLLLSLSDSVRAMLSTIEQKGNDGENDWAHLIEQLEAATEGRTASAAPVAAEPVVELVPAEVLSPVAEVKPVEPVAVAAPKPVEPPKPAESVKPVAKPEAAKPEAAPPAAKRRRQAMESRTARCAWMSVCSTT